MGVESLRDVVKHLTKTMRQKEDIYTPIIKRTTQVYHYSYFIEFVIIDSIYYYLPLSSISVFCNIKEEIAPLEKFEITAIKLEFQRQRFYELSPVPPEIESLKLKWKIKQTLKLFKLLNIFSDYLNNPNTMREFNEKEKNKIQQQSFFSA